MVLPSTNLRIQQLVDHWLQSGIPMESVTAQHCLSAVIGLTLVTNSVEQTNHIVLTILTQALELGYSSDWIIGEIQVEAQSWTAGNRADWLRSILAQSKGDDAALDMYMLRLNRFSLG